MRANWVKRVLFLADRTRWSTRRSNAFKTHLPGRRRRSTWSPRSDDDGRVYVSTYPTMMNLIDEADGGRARGSARATSTWS